MKLIELLARIFIKDRKNYADPDVRRNYGFVCGGFGIFLNVMLFALKLIFGTIAASVAMVADAFNNLSDAASSFISIIGFKLSAKKPDPEHPFGHGRLEYIAGLIIAFMIVLMGFELLKSSIDALVHPKPVQGGIFPVLVMCIAIAVKFYMYLYNHATAKKIDSVALEATAKDSLSDMIATSVVIASIIASKFTTFPVDGIAGIVVAIFILIAGIDAAKDVIKPLLGESPSPEFVKQIEAELMSHPYIVGMHDLVVHDYGPGRRMISLHAEVPGDQNIFDMHDAIDVAEVDIARKLNCFVVIHMDPIDTANEKLQLYKKIIVEEAKKIDEQITAHDLRMVPGPTHTNLIFDVVRPYTCKLTEDELRKTIAENVMARCENVFCVITIDNPYV